jgi:4-amino-4-deoxy-L-arabinose transferase-like glycosyltransferase
MWRFKYWYLISTAWIYACLADFCDWMSSGLNIFKVFASAFLIATLFFLFSFIFYIVKGIQLIHPILSLLYTIGFFGLTIASIKGARELKKKLN